MDKQQNQNLPCPRASTGIIYSPQHKKILVIGGADREKVLNDFWEIQIESKQTSQQLFGKEINQKQLPSNFSPRFGHTINLVDNYIYIFGGIYNDLFRYNIDKDELEKLSPKNLPIPRNSHSSCYDLVTNSIYIYGGANSEGPLNDLQVYNIKTNEFSELQFCDSGILQGREMHTMHTICEDAKFEKQDSVLESPGEIKFEQYKEGKIISADFSGPQLEKVEEKLEKTPENKVLFQQNIEFQAQENPKEKVENTAQHPQFIIIGGRTLDSISPYIYLIDSQLETHILKTLPQPICSHSSCVYKNNIYIYGGTNGKAFFNDIYIMELSTNNLFRCKIEQQMLQQMLSQRIASSMSVMEDSIVIFGGSEIDKENGEFIFLNTEHYSTIKNSELC